MIAPTPYVNRDTQPEPSGSKKPEAKLPLPTFTAVRSSHVFKYLEKISAETKAAIQLDQFGAENDEEGNVRAV